MNIKEKIVADILDISKKIFEINEKENPETIFNRKSFFIEGYDAYTEENKFRDRYYYFEHPEIEGVLIKRENNKGYCIKASVQYEISKTAKRTFEKINISNYFGKLCIRGRRTGSWKTEEIFDDDYTKKEVPELLLVLATLECSLREMYDEMCKDAKKGNDTYVSSWVKLLKKYNYNNYE